ncbi:hypothetical protein BDR22DRAFT_837477 [Usnea florida]
MTSYFERYGRLREVTMQAWQPLSSGHSTFEQRVSFWMKYLRDVTPDDVAVCHVPSSTQMFDLNPPDYPVARRMEIQLRCREGILMTGLVSTDYHNSYASDIIAFVAYEHSRDGLVVWDPRQQWGSFTCLQYIRFHVSENGRDYRITYTLHPITSVRDVARYIRHEYDRIRIR